MTPKTDWNFPDIPGDIPKRDARRAIVFPLWAEGKSASEIAAQFDNATRNSVIGLVSRGNLQRAKPEKIKAAKLKRERAANHAPAPKKVARNRNTMVATHPKPPESEVHASKWIDKERPPIPGTTPISILDLPNRDFGICRFPVVGGYCGVGCGEDVYCETHRTYAHQQRAPK